MKQTRETQRKELNECRAEITSLKMHIEGVRASGQFATGQSENVQSLQSDSCIDEIQSVNTASDNMKGTNSNTEISESIISLNEESPPLEVVQTSEETTSPNSVDPGSGSSSVNDVNQPFEQDGTNQNNVSSDQLLNYCNGVVESQENAPAHLFKSPAEVVSLIHKSDSPKQETTSEKMVILVSLAFVWRDFSLAAFVGLCGILN